MDVLSALKQMEDESVDMQITSPPYWGLRSYGGEEVEAIWDGDKNCEHEWNEIIKKGTFCSKCGAWKGQLGLEPSFDDKIIENL